MRMVRNISKREYNKARARLLAIQWQWNFTHYDRSYMYIAKWTNLFDRLGRKYGLLREFRENGIL